MNVSGISSFSVDAYQELFRRRQESGADAVDAVNTGFPAMAAGAAAQSGMVDPARYIEENDRANREVQALADGGMDPIGQRQSTTRPDELLRSLDNGRPAITEAAETEMPRDGLYASAMQDFADRGATPTQQGDFVNFMLSRVHAAYGL